MAINNKLFTLLLPLTVISVIMILVITLRGVGDYFRPKTAGNQNETAIQTPYALVNNTRINLEVARSDAEKIRGLGYRDSLDQNTGMLFVYELPARHTFWMQGMRFALDFLWIDNNRVEDLHENVLPPAQTNNTPAIVTPGVAVRYIVEVNSGFIKAHKIKKGDPVTLKL